MRIRLVFCLCLLACANLVLALQRDSGYPNTDYFSSHSRADSWDRINKTFQRAEDRFADEKTALDAERDRRLSHAVGDAAQATAEAWYTAESGKLERKRAKEYDRKEACQKALND